MLSAMRAAVTSAALIPGLKALVARHTGQDAWLNIRPPHTRLSAEAASRLFATFDACGCSWRGPLSGRPQAPPGAASMAAGRPSR